MDRDRDVEGVGNGRVVVEDRLIVLRGDGGDEHALGAELLGLTSLFDRTGGSEREHTYPGRKRATGLVHDGGHDMSALRVGQPMSLAHEAQDADSVHADLHLEVDDAPEGCARLRLRRR